jgi:hypothetical protein
MIAEFLLGLYCRDATRLPDPPHCASPAFHDKPSQPAPPARHVETGTQFCYIKKHNPAGRALVLTNGVR